MKINFEGIKPYQVLPWRLNFASEQAVRMNFRRQVFLAPVVSFPYAQSLLVIASPESKSAQSQPEYLDFSFKLERSQCAGSRLNPAF